MRFPGLNENLSSEVEPDAFNAGEKLAGFFENFSWKEDIFGIHPKRFFYGEKSKDEVSSLMQLQLEKGAGFQTEQAAQLSKEWSGLSGEEAYKKFAEYAPDWAESVRQQLFPEITEIEEEVDIMEEISPDRESTLAERFKAYFTLPEELYSKVRGADEEYYNQKPRLEQLRFPIENLTVPGVGKAFLDLADGAMEKIKGKDAWRQWKKDLYTEVHITEEKWTPFHSIMMGGLAAVPVAREVIEFKGGGPQRVSGNASDKVLYGLGYLTIMISQLIGMSKMAGKAYDTYGKLLRAPVKATRGVRVLPYKFDIFDKHIFKMTGRVLESPETSNIALAGTRISRALMQGFRGGLNFASLTATQVALDNFITDKQFDNNDAVKIAKSGGMGYGMAYLGTWWAGTNLPFLLSKFGEEVTQAGLASVLQAFDVYNMKGHLDNEDFWNIFMYEMWESIPENIIPVVMGMSPFSSQMTIDQKVDVAKNIAVRTKAKLLKASMKDLTTDAAIRDARIVVDKAMETYRAKHGGRTPGAFHFNRIIRGIKDGTIKETFEAQKDAEGKSKFYEEIQGDPQFRQIAHDYEMRFNKIHPDNVKVLFNDPMLHYPKLEKAAIDNEDEVYSNVAIRLMTVKDQLDYVNDEDLGALRSRIGEAYGGRGWDMRVRINRDLSLDRDAGRMAYDEAVDESFIKIKQGEPVSLDMETMGRLTDIPPMRPQQEAIVVKDPAKAVDAILSKWIEANYGAKFDPKYLTKYEYNHIMSRMDRWEKVGGEDYAKVMIETLMEGEGVSLRAKAADMMDYVKGMPQFFEKLGGFDKYNAIRVGDTKFIHELDNSMEDITGMMLRNCGARGFGGNWILKDNAMKIVHYYMGTSEKIFTFDNLIEKLEGEGFHVDTPSMRTKLRNAIGEYSAYLTSNRSSPYWKPENWNIKKGLLEHFNIPYGTRLSQFFPLMRYINQPDSWEGTVSSMRNVHEKVRTENVEKMPDYDMWMKNWELGWKGINQYIKRGLRTKHMGPAIEAMAQWRDANAANINTTSRGVMDRWLTNVVGRPDSGDKAMYNSISTAINKIPIISRFYNVESKDMPVLIDTAMSFIYAGGLGIKVSAAIKNAFQGPMNNPPGMTSLWWMRGLYKTLTDPQARHIAKMNGIVDIFAVAGLQKDFQGRISSGLQKTLMMFTAVDHWWNRVPIYMGARMQYDYYINKFGILEGTQKIMSKQDPETAKYFVELAEQAQMAEDYTKDKTASELLRRFNSDEAEGIIESIRDQYGFLQQANSNWEYGKLGRPHIFGTAKAKIAGTFLTWPTWYYGTYLPSLWHNDPTGLLRHWAKQAIVISMMSRLFSMNMKPWMFTGPMPAQPYGPTLQTFFNAIGVVKGWEYNNAEMRAQALDDLKRSAKVFMPGFYGVNEWVTLIRDFNRDAEYFDNKTGEIHYARNQRYIWSKFLGVPNMHAEMERARKLLRLNQRREAQRIARRFNIKFMSKIPGSGGISGTPVLGGIR